MVNLLCLPWLSISINVGYVDFSEMFLDENKEIDYMCEVSVSCNDDY